jgi:hypothetical protein
MFAFRELSEDREIRFPDDAPRRFVAHTGVTIADANALIF